MKYYPFVLLCLLCACKQNTRDAPPAPEEPGLEAVVEEQEVVALREIEDYNPDGDERPLDDLIVVNDLPAESLISSPYTVTGRARGTWFFEGSFHVVLIGEDGALLAESFGHSPENWMTEEFIPFTVELEWDAPASTKASLELMLDNPAGEEGMDRAIIIPVLLE